MKMLFGFLLILPLMLIIITGNLLYRYKFLKDSDVNCLARLLYWVVLPTLLFKTSYLSGRELLQNFSLFIAAGCAYIITGVIAWFVSAKILRRGAERSAASIMASIRSNNLYVGFPVVQMALGDKGLVCAAIYLATTSIAFHAVSITGSEIALHGRLTAQKSKKIGIDLLFNPLLISCVFGVVFSLLPFPLPDAIMQTTTMMGNAATAIALIALGASLRLDTLSDTLKLFSVTWCDNLLRFVVAPIVMFCALHIFHIAPLLSTVSILLTCMPAAVNCFVLAKGMDMDEKYMAGVVASTTVVSAIAIPLWVMILNIG